MKLCECGCGKPTPISKQTRTERGHIKGQPTRFCPSHGNLSCVKNFGDDIGVHTRKHGMYRASEYRAYCAAKYRCNNPNDASYQEYGGRGIEFRFKSFDEFIQHIGPKPDPKLSLDRIDNNGNYEIGNVRWATSSQQLSNKRYRATTADELAEIATFLTFR